jgi:hypothetical protein
LTTRLGFVQSLFRQTPHFIHLVQLEVGNSSIGHDSNQREQLKPKRPPGQALALVLISVVTIHYGFRNLQFGPQNMRNFLITLAGCSGLAFGFGLFLRWILS